MKSNHHFLINSVGLPFFVSVKDEETGESKVVLNKARVMEVLLFAGLTMFGTVNVMSYQMQDTRNDITQMSLKIDDINTKTTGILINGVNKVDMQEIETRVREVESKHSAYNEKFNTIEQEFNEWRTEHYGHEKP